MSTFWRMGALGVFILVIGVSSGLWIASERAKENSLLSRVERKTMAYLRSALTYETPTEGEITTNRLVLKTQIINVPIMVTDSGGGIAEAPDGGILLLDRIGQVFHHLRGKTIKLNIETPDNGLEDLSRQHAAGQLGETTFNARGFRFNDILALERGESVELFISYSDWVSERLCYRSILAHATLPRALKLADWTVGRSDWRILKATEPCLPPMTSGPAVVGIEAGGRIIERSDTEVVWSTGVYELDDEFKQTRIDPYAQRNQSEYGRLLSINFRTGETTVLARGLRNPQGLTGSEDGRIWVTDHGMRGGDELNLVEAGKAEYNFGWPYVSYGTHYNRRPVSVSGRHEGHSGYDLPLYSFVPSVAPGAAIFVENFHPVWDGDVLVGSFRSTIERVHVVDGRVIFVETIPTGVRTRDMVLTKSGSLVIWTDNLQLIFLTPSVAPSAVDRMFASIDRIADNGERDLVREVIKGCLQCHSLARGEIMSGPSLHGICGARMGAADGYTQYSTALASSGRLWSESLIAEFILDPQSVVPGTSMAWEGVQGNRTAAKAAALICSNSD